MILEGIVTTINDDGGTNISPMGAVVDRTLSHVRLRPYRSSTTYRNLKRTEQAVLHVTDDVELLARTAVGQPQPLPQLIEAPGVQGRILVEACRWYAVRVRRLDDRDERAEADCDIVEQGRMRDFFGFNRAKHAVVEAAILATRQNLLPAKEILEQYRHLGTIVEKTGGDQEQRAFTFLLDYVTESSA